MGALATGFASAAKAQTSPAGTAGGNTGSQTVLQLQRRSIEVNGKPASVFGIRQPDGTFGIATDVGRPFRVRVENQIDEPSLIHWHGLTPPWQQDGVPGISGPPIPPAGSAEYDFPLRFSGTFWMHSHQGLQEQSLMAAPLIIHDERNSTGVREVVVMLDDFSFTRPEQILQDLRKRTAMPQMAGASSKMAGMTATAPSGAGAAGDLNDVNYDAFLANHRTLADPEVVRVEPGEEVLLRIINASSMTNYHIELGHLQGRLIAVDGFPIVAQIGRRFPITAAQRLDIRLGLPREATAYPILALVEGERRQTGIVAGGRPRGYRARSGDDWPVLAGSDTRFRAPPARGRTAEAAQARPGSHAQPDRRDDGLYLVDQQHRLEQGRPVATHRGRRADRACHDQPHRHVASDAPTRS
jgi:FtsP/CotA-like multicopper oxidase with cupredoxin domain